MFKINKPTRTIHGEFVVPFLVEGRLVHVLDKNKNQKTIDLSEFDFEPKKKTPKKQTLVIVKPSQTSYTKEEPLFHPQESGYMGGEYAEKDIVIQPPTTIPEPTPTPIINETPIEIKVDETIPQDTPIIYPDSKPNFINVSRLLIIRLSGKAVSIFEPKIDTKIADDFYGGF